MNLTSHIQELQAAILRSEEEMYRMRVALGPDMCPCCVGAAYGGTIGPYCKLERKLDRQEAWLRILVAKVKGDDVEVHEAGAVYSKLVARHRRVDSATR